ncbi:kinase-like protein [Aureobasidium subglaciale]|nr:kinase-like protein [Aureobasidium subglaciale]
MPRRRPPALSLGNALICIFVWLPLIATAQQQQSGSNNANLRKRSSLSNSRPSQELRSTHNHKHLKDTAIDPSIERALATFAPADSLPAVRAPPARSSASSGALSSRHPARSLQDWQVEDIILLATVDGKLHARDRRTGAPRWEIEADRPMIETIYHHNDSDPESQPDTRLIWIVEPSQDGSLYVYSSEPQNGMQKLGLSVKQLVEELSPYAGEDPPVVYTADKKNTLYTVDASNGKILKMFSSSASTFSNDQNCRRVDGLGSLEDNECETIGTLTLGRTEYTVSIADKMTGNPICTIRYFEWGPNNRDKDLHNQYASTMDSKYIYTQHDGSVVAVDYRETSRFGNSILYKQKFSSPVARVYDIVRPLDEEDLDASLVILPQPIGPAGDDTIEQDKVFVNCTESGSWYAMSELRYPTVTDGASNAVCYTQGYALPAGTFNPAKQRASLVGIHPLHPMSQDQSEILTIGGPDQSVLGSPNAYNTDNAQVMLPNAVNAWAGLTSSGLIALLALVGLFAIVSRWVDVQKIIQRQSPEPLKMKEAPIPVTSRPREIVDENSSHIEPLDRKVRFPEPAQETIFPQGEGEAEKVMEPAPVVEAPVEIKVDSPARASTPPPAEVDTPAEDQTPVKPKKKATRGVRGGRKAKEKRAEQLEAQQRRRENSQSNSDKESNGTSVIPVSKALSKIDGMDVISVDASESPNVSGKIQINNLTIDTDRIIGHGSAGTCVFEGKFEGRDVAVKRMLSQYYELASQEVSFLQQSDHDKNVIRYYCQQKDQHFLYIAVELCQASLWDLFNLPDIRDEVRYQQLQSLAQAVQRDARGALYQLAKGLYHLHDLRIIHRDIKPQNILIAFPKPNRPNELRLVISDFGLCKTLPENVSTLIDPTSNAGTCGWKAPELISQPKDTASNNGHSNISHPGTSESSTGGTMGGVKRAADIFSLGCLFFWVLTGGDHPYDDKEGWMQMRELNIKKNNLQNMHKLDLGSDTEEPRQLITAMLAHNPEDRPSAQQVLCHPFFWSSKKRLDFLCDVSDHFEHEPRDPPSPHLCYLESYADMVIDAKKDKDWQRKLDRMFLDTLGKQRKYNGAKMLDLLRALRNKKNHYEDMSADVKKRVGSLPEGYLGYFTIRFPMLVMACFWAIKDCRVEGNARFRGYYSVEEQQ